MLVGFVFDVKSQFGSDVLKSTIEMKRRQILQFNLIAKNWRISSQAEINEI